MRKISQIGKSTLTKKKKKRIAFTFALYISTFAPIHTRRERVF